MASDDFLLHVNKLQTCFFTDDGVVKVLDGIGFSIGKGKTLGVVGESGCGKSVTALSIMQLIFRSHGRIVGGQIFYRTKDGQVIDIASIPPNSRRMRNIRGNEIAMVFQEPMTSLNPVFTIGQQITEAVRLHRKLNRREAREHTLDMLRRVRIPNPEQSLNGYPHELSGGMRQRALIAMSLSCDPGLLIADEPTTALDVTIEAQILSLMQDLQKNMGMSIGIITHDMGVIGEMADNVIVMYCGKVVERASTYHVFYEPKHPYTVGLLESMPRIGEKKEIIPIEGTVPSILELPKGCSFSPRCRRAMGVCHSKEPPLFIINSEQAAKCWLYENCADAEARE